MDTLQDICHLITDGKHGDCKDDDSSGFYFVSCKDVRDGWIDYFGARQITEEDFRDTHRRTRLEPNDIVITNSGTIGRMALVTNAPETARTTFQKSVAIIKPDVNKVVSLWLYYYLSGRRDELIGWAGGTAQKNLLLRDLRAFRVSIPPLPTQRKIAAILSAYDDLIENNLRRIKILEEMAQNLYREWFVKFRFPGHQHARFVDSTLGRIPEGWEVREIQEIAEVIDCLHSKKPQHNESGTGLLLQLFNIGNGGKVDLTKKYLLSDTDYQEWTSRIEVRAGDCVVTNVGRVGAVAQIPTGLVAAIGRNMTALRPFAVGPTYLIEYLLSSHMTKEVLIKKDAGAIMDSLNVKGIVKLLVPTGPRPLMDAFEASTRPMRALVERLYKKNNILRRTRDLLLPRLISGEVDVSELDIALPEEVAYE